MTLERFICKLQYFAFAIMLFNALHSFTQYGDQSRIDPQCNKSFDSAKSWEMGFSRGFSKYFTSINQKIKIILGKTWFTVNTDRLDGFHPVTYETGGTTILIKRK